MAISTRFAEQIKLRGFCINVEFPFVYFTVELSISSTAAKFRQTKHVYFSVDLIRE